MVRLLSGWVDHNRDLSFVDPDESDDVGSIDEGHDFIHEYMVNMTTENYARLGLTMPREQRNPFNMD